MQGTLHWFPLEAGCAFSLGGTSEKPNPSLLVIMTVLPESVEQALGELGNIGFYQACHIFHLITERIVLCSKGAFMRIRIISPHSERFFHNSKFSC